VCFEHAGVVNQEIVRTGALLLESRAYIATQHTAIRSVTRRLRCYNIPNIPIVCPRAVMGSSKAGARSVHMKPIGDYDGNRGERIRTRSTGVLICSRSRGC
jgi:hypothetical protein